MKPEYGKPKSLDDVSLADVQEFPIWVWVWEAGLEKEAEDETWQCPIVNTKDVTDEMAEPVITLRVKGTDVIASASYKPKLDHLGKQYPYGKIIVGSVFNSLNWQRRLFLSLSRRSAGMNEVEFAATELRKDRAIRCRTNMHLAIGAKTLLSQSVSVSEREISHRRCSMADVSFACPSCQQVLEAPPEMAGELVSCPSCQKDILVPKSVQQQAQPRKEPSQARPQPPSVPVPPTARPQSEIQTNVKQGALIGGFVCFALGIVFMFISMWSFFLYGPLFLAAFVLSIVAMAQRRVLGGVGLLLLTLIVPGVLGLILFSTRAAKVADSLSKQMQATTQKETASPSPPKSEWPPARPSLHRSLMCRNPRSTRHWTKRMVLGILSLELPFRSLICRPSK